MLVHVWLQVPYTVHSSKSGKRQGKKTRFGPENASPSLPEEGMRLLRFSRVELERRG